MTDLRKAESELDEGLRLGALLWPRKMAAELRRLHEVNQMLVEAGEVALAALEAKGDLWIALERKAKETLRQALSKAKEQA